MNNKNSNQNKKNSNFLQKLGIGENEKSTLEGFQKCLQKNNYECLKQVLPELTSFSGVNKSIIVKISNTKKINKNDINKFNRSFTSLEKALLGEEFIKCVKKNCNEQDYKEGLNSLSGKINSFVEKVNNKNGNSKSIENKFTIDILTKLNSLILKFIKKLDEKP
jgi:hypothetical protein